MITMAHCAPGSLQKQDEHNCTGPEVQLVQISTPEDESFQIPKGVYLHGQYEQGTEHIDRKPGVFGIRPVFAAQRTQEKAQDHYKGKMG